MSENIAKRYVKALIEVCKKDELNDVLKGLKAIVSAFGVAKFNDIIKSPTVSKKDKISLILSFLKEPNVKIENLLKILMKNGRISLLPQIYDGIKESIALSNNEYQGKIYTKENLDEPTIKLLETNFSKKLNANIKFVCIAGNYTGVKIDISDLGYEICFSIDRLKSAMSEYILKAI